MQVILEVSHSKAKLKRVVLKKDTLIGRGQRCNLRIASSDVSREHCKIKLTDTTVSICDLGSSNGTLVGDKQIPPNQDVALLPGSRLEIGPMKFVVKFDAPKPAVADVEIFPDASDMPDTAEFKSYVEPDEAEGEDTVQLEATEEADVAVAAIAPGVTDVIDVEPVDDNDVVDLEVTDVEVADVKVADVKVADVKVADVKVADVKVADVEVADVEVADVEVADVPMLAEVEVEAELAETMDFDNAPEIAGALANSDIVENAFDVEEVYADAVVDDVPEVEAVADAVVDVEPIADIQPIANIEPVGEVEVAIAGDDVADVAPEAPPKKRSLFGMFKRKPKSTAEEAEPAATDVEPAAAPEGAVVAEAVVADVDAPVPVDVDEVETEFVDIDPEDVDATINESGFEAEVEPAAEYVEDIDDDDVMKFLSPEEQADQPADSDDDLSNFFNQFK